MNGINDLLGMFNFIYFERMCHMMHDIYNKTTPNNLNNLFKLISELHHYRTRSALNQCFYTETITTEKKKLHASHYAPPVLSKLFTYIQNSIDGY